MIKQFPTEVTPLHLQFVWVLIIGKLWQVSIESLELLQSRRSQTEVIRSTNALAAGRGRNIAAYRYSHRTIGARKPKLSKAIQCSLQFLLPFYEALKSSLQSISHLEMI